MKIMFNEIALHAEDAERRRRLTREHAARHSRREPHRFEGSTPTLRRRWHAVVTTLRHRGTIGRRPDVVGV